MATFEAIGLNLAVGSFFTITSLVMFTAAVHWGFNDKLAPRTWARPKDVIKNVLEGPYYGLSWIPWTLSLSFQQMLEGLPGTGTRKNGWSGKFLHCNLDGIIVIKFHALCLRVAVFASCLCIFVVLPLNVTAPCYPMVSGMDLCSNITNLTNFEQTTLANIPPLRFPSRVVEIDAGGGRIPSIEEIFPDAPGSTWRLYVIVVVAWAIFFYSCFLIWNEWIDNLALRRVFYLEHDHFRERKDELHYLNTLSDPEMDGQSDRPPYIPHPEIRDTIPNIALYSVLYKLPDYFFSTAASPSTSVLQRQLASTVEFFDKCVPNQPGYSSAVAAVTILPDASQVAKAWREWYKCAGKLRRLRFIRSRIRELEKELKPANEEQGDQDIEIPRHFNSFESSDPSEGPERNLSRTGHAESTPVAGAITDLISSERLPGTDRAISPSTLPSTEAVLSKSQGTPLPRHRKDLVVLPTVKELDNVARDVSQDGVSKKPEMSQTTGGPVAPIDLESGMLDRASSTNEGAQASPAIPPGRTSPDEFPYFSDALGPYSGDSADLPDDDDRAVRESGVPSIDTLPSPSTETYDTNAQQHYFSGTDLRKSPDSYGLAEESRLDHFLSDDGIEQHSAYCREYAQSSAACCVYGCDYWRLAQADLETLQELEEETVEMLEEANQALVEARASVNKDAIDIESGAFGESLLGRRNVAGRRAAASTENGDMDAHADSEMTSSGYRKHSNDTGNGSMSCRHFFESIPSESEGVSSEEKWKIVGDIADESRKLHTPRRTHGLINGMSSGRWRFNSTDSFLGRLRDMTQPRPPESVSGKNVNLVAAVVDHHIYAVVTFTSRQAAIAARQCTADGSGLGRWQEVEDLPIPPLADAAPWDFFQCKRCCRPATLTINDSEKRCRKNITWLVLVLMCCLYTLPLSETSRLFSAKQLARWFPGLELHIQISGLLTGLLYTAFFSVCPFIFKSLANFGSNATSLRQAEYRAIQYYWIFILSTAFTGSSLATMIRSAIYSDLNVGASAQEVLRQVAMAIPTQISATWLNWILVRFLFMIPLVYLVQFNTFLFSAMGLKCCARCTRGGGPGAPLPFRIFVDSGVVFLCIVALAPACPMVAPVGMLYYLVMTPVLRWILIFVHRPRHDGGGHRWPLLHDILVSSMLVAQILLTTMMVLKLAYGPAMLAALSIVPTFMFSQVAKDRFLRCYNDAGLVQTSQLDGWDVSKSKSTSEREAFRKWLVDCHKASYIPICLAGMESYLTAEPAVVIPTEKDRTTRAGNVMELRGPNARKLRTMSQESLYAQRSRLDTMDSAFASMNSTGSQRCTLFRRVPHSVTLNSGMLTTFPPLYGSQGSHYSQ